MATDYTAFHDDVVVVKLALIALTNTTTSAPIHQRKFHRTFVKLTNSTATSRWTAPQDKPSLGHWKDPENNHGNTKRLFDRTRI